MGCLFLGLMGHQPTRETKIESHFETFDGLPVVSFPLTQVLSLGGVTRLVKGEAATFEGAVFEAMGWAVRRAVANRPAGSSLLVFPANPANDREWGERKTRASDSRPFA